MLENCDICIMFVPELTCRLWPTQS